ncbi:MAG: hypothetical protein AAGB02_01225 [Pseudomonadota bacterium]
MSIPVKAGMKLHSVVCSGQIMVLRAPAGELDIACGGAPMAAAEPAEKTALDPAQTAGVLVGKRYVDADETMEFLCTRAGEGTLSVNGVPLDIKQAKQLPSSD